MVFTPYLLRLCLCYIYFQFRL